MSIQIPSGYEIVMYGIKFSDLFEKFKLVSSFD